MRNTIVPVCFSLLLLSAAPTVLVADATSALAADPPDPSKSPAKDDILLTQGEVKSLEKKMAATVDWATDEKARESARSSKVSVVAGMKRIRAADPKWNLSAWEALVSSVEARLKKADDAVAQGAAKDEQVRAAFSKYAGEHAKVRDILELVATVKNKPDSVAIDSEQIFQKTVPQIASLAALDKTCTDTGVATMTAPPEYKNQKPAETCKLAAEWKTLGAAYVGLQAKGAGKREADRATKVLEKAKAGELVDVARHLDLLAPSKIVDRLKKVYGEGAKTFGATVDATAFDPVLAAAKPYPEALAEAAKTSRWDKAAKLTDAGIAAAITAEHTKGGGLEEGKLVKHGSFADWAVDKDVFGVPLRRSRSVQVLMQIGSEKHCRLYTRSYEATYDKGVWSKPYANGAAASFRVSACK